MKFCEYITSAQENIKRSSKELFLQEIVSALCGETEPEKANEGYSYSKHLPEGLTGDDIAYRKSFFSCNNKKYKGLTSKISEYILANKNKETFLIYCNRHLIEKGAENLCAAYDVATTISKDALLSAMYYQFIAFAESKTDDVPNIIPEKSDSYHPDIDDKLPPSTKPLYQNDDFTVTDNRPRIAYRYEKFKIIWVITNKGRVTWQRRTLDIASQQITGVRVLTPKLEIPTLKPKAQVKLEVDCDARHFDGNWELIWEIKDSVGRNCFPNKNGLRQTVTVAGRKPEQ